MPLKLFLECVNQNEFNLFKYNEMSMHFDKTENKTFLKNHIIYYKLNILILIHSAFFIVITSKNLEYLHLSTSLKMIVLL